MNTSPRHYSFYAPQLWKHLTGNLKYTEAVGSFYSGIKPWIILLQLFCEGYRLFDHFITLSEPFLAMKTFARGHKHIKHLWCLRNRRSELPTLCFRGSEQWGLRSTVVEPCHLGRRWTLRPGVLSSDWLDVGVTRMLLLPHICSVMVYRDGNVARAKNGVLHISHKAL